MRQPILEALYGQDFAGVPEVEGRPWPRRDAVAQGGQALRGLPDAWRDACRRMETARPEVAAEIDALLAPLCTRYDRAARVAALGAALAARAEAEARALERPGMLVEPPDEMCREAYAEALHEAEALSDDDPDKTELVAVRRRMLRTYFDYPRRSPEERRAVLRAFLDDPER